MSSALPTTGGRSSTSVTSWRSRTKAEPQRPAHTSVGSWILSKFTGAYKNRPKLLREGDEETAAGRRRPVGTLSAVANQQQANAARRGEMGQATSTLRRQQSFLRQQLLEMKQQSAEALARAQKRINGEALDDERGDDDTRDSCGDRDKDSDKDRDKDDEGGEEEEDDACRARGDGPGAAATGVVDAARESWSSDPARSRSSSLRRRSAAEEQQERDDEMLAHEVQRDEYSEEADRRMSQATQLYAEAISALDFALRPGRKRHHSEPSPKPLLLGVKRGSPNMPKSEWV